MPSPFIGIRILHIIRDLSIKSLYLSNKKATHETHGSLFKFLIQRLDGH